MCGKLRGIGSTTHHALDKGSQDWQLDFTSEVGEKQGDVLGFKSITLLKNYSRSGTSTNTHIRRL
jgi:hypothetical protein